MTTRTASPAGRSEAGVPPLLGYLGAIIFVGGSTALGLLIVPRWGNGPVDLV